MHILYGFHDFGNSPSSAYVDLVLWIGIFPLARAWALDKIYCWSQDLSTEPGTKYKAQTLYIFSLSCDLISKVETRRTDLALSRLTRDKVELSCLCSLVSVKWWSSGRLRSEEAEPFLLLYFLYTSYTRDISSIESEFPISWYDCQSCWTEMSCRQLSVDTWERP
jgi:hypothetical protein